MFGKAGGGVERGRNGGEQQDICSSGSLCVIATQKGAKKCKKASYFLPGIKCLKALAENKGFRAENLGAEKSSFSVSD